MSRTELPEDGPGSIAQAAPRLGAFLIDVVASALVAGLFTAPELPRNRSLLVFAVAYFVYPPEAVDTVCLIHVPV